MPIHMYLVKIFLKIKFVKTVSKLEITTSCVIVKDMELLI